jgi:hypothetical protein
MSKKSGEGLPLVAFRFKGDEERHYDEFQLAHALRVRGWVVPAYTMAPHTENMKMLRIVVREDFSRSRCDSLICDIKLTMGLLDNMDKESIKKQTELIHKHHTASGKSPHNHPKYKVRYTSWSDGYERRGFTNLCAEGETLTAGEDWKDACGMLRRTDSIGGEMVLSLIVDQSDDRPTCPKVKGTRCAAF